ncbi:MAG: hypothetical protein ACMUJM_15015 [bacterium]
MENKSKDKWDKIDIILKPTGGLLAAVVVTLIGFFSTRSIERIKRIETLAMQERQSKEACARLYSELMSKREEAESSLRKDMFSQIINDFLRPGKDSLDSPEKRLLNLELLVYNFHESLNLKPLFIDLKKELGHNEENLRRLNKLAREVTSKQMLVLEGPGKKFSRTIDLESLNFLSRKRDPNNQLLTQYVQEDLTVGDIKRNFTIDVMEVRHDTKELKINLEVRKYKESTSHEVDETVKASFWIGTFDFPMIDNTRLSHNQRCALVVNGWEKSTVNISLIYYPGCYASLKEKPYYLEVIQNLLKTNELLFEKMKNPDLNSGGCDEIRNNPQHSVSK